jgi:ethylene-insensitive protein 3
MVCQILFTDLKMMCQRLLTSVTEGRYGGTHNSSDEYDVVGFEDAPLSTSSKDAELDLSPVAQPPEDHARKILRERAYNNRPNQIVPNKVGTNEPQPQKRTSASQLHCYRV